MLHEQSSGMTWTISSTESYQQIEQGFLQWLQKKEVGKRKNICIFLQMPGCEDFQIHCICQRALPTSERMPALETFPNFHNLHNSFTSHPKLLSLHNKAFELPSPRPIHAHLLPSGGSTKISHIRKEKHNAAQSWRSLTVGDNKSSFSLELQRKLQVSHMVSP